MAERFDAGGRLFAFGNGGSSTDAAGIVSLFSQPPSGRPLPARSLVADHAVLTALANDVGYELVFSRQLISTARAGDIALGLSTSGGSVNLLRAFAEARAARPPHRRSGGLRRRGDGGIRRPSTTASWCAPTASTASRRRRAPSCSTSGSASSASLPRVARMPADAREAAVLERIEAFRRRRPRLTDEIITLAHGAGGKSSAALVDAVFLEAFANDALEPARRRRPARARRRRPAVVQHRLVRGAPAVLPRRVDRAPGRARHRQRRRHARCPAALAVGRVRDRGGLRDRRAPRHRGRHGRGGAGRRRDHRGRRHEGGGPGRRRRPLHHDRRRRRAPRRPVARRRSSCSPATSCSCRAPSPTTAWR